MGDWTTDQYSAHDYYAGPLLQYPAKTNSFETKFEADRAMALRMSANPMPTLITPQLGCNDELRRGGPISVAKGASKSESFSGGDVEEQIASVVKATGGWFNLILIILVVLVAVYQYKIYNMVCQMQSKKDQN